MTMMENFLTWDILLTFGGCVAATVLLTEWLKKMFAKLPAQLVSFIVATLILVVGHLATSTFVPTEIPMYLINAVAVSLSANGGFDILDKAFGKKEQINNELVISGNGENSETYLNLGKVPEAYTDGEVVTFKVKKVSHE
jgi:hypothetical protein